MKACINNNYNAVKFLVSKGANLNIPNKEGFTPVACASGEGYLKIVKYLVKNGADVNCGAGDYWFPLELAVSNNKYNVANYLIDINVEPLYKNENSSHLIWASYEGYLHIVKYLIETKNVNINYKDNKGISALHWACNAKYIDIKIVKYLVSHGANINDVDINGETPLIFACRKGDYEAVKYLISKGANINKKNKRGISPAEMAFSCNGDQFCVPSEYSMSWNAYINIEIIELLAKENANISKHIFKLLEDHDDIDRISKFLKKYKL
jgi:ankyrin repeat protein